MNEIVIKESDSESSIVKELYMQNSSMYIFLFDPNILKSYYQS